MGVKNLAERRLLQIEKAYKFRIYPNKVQEEQIQKTFGCCRFVFNYYLAKRKEIYENEKRTFNYYDCCKDLTYLKKELTWLKDADAKALQSSLKDLDDAYKNFFRRVKNGENPGFPKFKSKKNNRKSYKTKIGIKIIDNKIQLPKLGFVKCKVSKLVEGRIISAFVSQNPIGKYFVSVCVTDYEPEQLEKTGSVVGIDLGIKEFAITSDGVKYENPKFFLKSQKKLARLQRQLSRKSSGSNRRNKARIKVAKQYEKVHNQRIDFLHKLSTDLVKTYDVIAIEDLAPSNMVKNHKLSKSISDVSWGEFRRQLEYKANWHGNTVVKIDRFYPSSQLCSNCGAKWAGTKDLSIRKWTCPECGTEHDRDINAAINILNEGLRIINQ